MAVSLDAEIKRWHLVTKLVCDLAMLLRLRRILDKHLLGDEFLSILDVDVELLGVVSPHSVVVIFTFVIVGLHSEVKELLQ